MLLWLLIRLTYLAGERDGVKCIFIAAACVERERERGRERWRHCRRREERKGEKESGMKLIAWKRWHLCGGWEDGGVERSHKKGKWRRRDRGKYFGGDLWSQNIWDVTSLSRKQLNHRHQRIHRKYVFILISPPNQDDFPEPVTSLFFVL